MRCDIKDLLVKFEWFGRSQHTDLGRDGFFRTKLVGQAFRIQKTPCVFGQGFRTPVTDGMLSMPMFLGLLGDVLLQELIRGSFEV